MDFNNFNSFDDFVRFCRECNNDNNDNNEEDCDCKFGSKNAEASECSRNADSDIPGGFQDINPQLFTIVTAIIGTVVANNLPFNIQNALGNWLELLGQSIITFNAQQQYFQGGPGRIYNPIYRNAANPFCSSSSDESQKNINVDSGSTDNATDNKGTNKKNKGSNSTGNNSKEIEELRRCVFDLTCEIGELKKEIEKMKKKDMY